MKLMEIVSRLTLKDLPASVQGKTGWPWTETIEPLPECLPDGSEWPRISIVTPSYNYGRFIEETIRSVLLQGYPNLEYIIIDGGSTDETLEIIKKYEQYLTYWISQPDDGQTDAINKGFERTTGDVFAWLNSDDAYMDSKCLHTVAELYRAGYQLIVGQCHHVDGDNNDIVLPTDDGCARPQTFDDYCKFWSYEPLPQPAVFVDRNLSNSCFLLDKTLFWTMDYQFFLRVLSFNPTATWINQDLVRFKFHGENKTMNSTTASHIELLRVATEEVAKKYNPLKSFLFGIDARDQATLFNLVDAIQHKNLTLARIMAVLLSHPTLVRWPLFWKVFLKQLMGHSLYDRAKQLHRKSLSNE